MKSVFHVGVICVLFYLAAVATVSGATWVNPGCCSDGCGGCGCGDSSGSGYNWWSVKGCACRNDCCDDDCGHPCCGSRAGGCGRCGCGCRPMTCHDKTYCGPLTAIFSIFTHDSWSSCGCGQRYWGDFYGDPPDYCDPCDRCGNYTGRWNGWGGGNGCGCGGTSYGGTGCTNCGGGQPTMEQVSPSPVPMEGRVVHQGDRVSRQVPTPASKTRKIVNQ
jgi:hypothetical protein